LTVTESAQNLKMFAVQNGRDLRRGKQLLFSSQSPASVALNFNENEIEVVYNAETASKITLFIGKKPARILLDDRGISANAVSFNSADGTISLNIPGSGQHVLKIIFR
jgi:hypothetical protein